MFLTDLFDAIERAVPEGWGEVAVTLLVVAAVVAIRRYSTIWCERREPGDAWSRVLVSAGAAFLTGVSALMLVAIWGLFRPLINSIETLGLTDLGGELVLSIVLLGGAYALTSVVRQFVQELTVRDNPITEHQREIIYRVTQLVLYTIAGLAVVSLFTNDPSSLLVGAGFVGIVVGMAARQTLGAVLAGFVLMFSRPFEVGDWVEIDDREGTVTEISVFNTRIQTFDGEYVMLPNDQVSGSAIVNRTRKGRLRVEVEVGVDYEDDPARAAEVVHDAVRGLDEVLSIPTPQVVAKRFADSAVVLGVRVWIDNPSARRMWRARTAVIESVKAALEREGVSIPFPQRTLSGREDGPVPLVGSEGVAVEEGTRSQASADGGESTGGDADGEDDRVSSSDDESETDDPNASDGAETGANGDGESEPSDDESDAEGDESGASDGEESTPNAAEEGANGDDETEAVDGAGER